MPKIVVIENEMHHLRVIELNLKASGFTVFTSTNGEDGLKVVVQEHPDLVLLDIKMPGLSGWEILSSLRGMEQSVHKPVIIMTAFLGKNERQHARKMGADYLAKPFSIPELLGAVTHALGREA